MTVSHRLARLLGHAGKQLPVRLACARPMSTAKYNYDTLEKDNFLGLKRLPIPELEETMPKYLKSIEPILTAEEFQKAKAEVAEFVDSATGKGLQAKLKSEDSHEGYPYSYIQKHWDDMYLTIRCPAPVNVSPYFKLVDDPSKSQCRRAAEFALGYVKWTRKILDGTLEPCSGGKGSSLCHSAYKYMIGISKIPKKDRDVIELYPESRTLTVISKGNIFSVEVLTADGKMVTADVLEKQLEEIAAAPAAQTSICALTSEDRDVWAEARARLEADPANAAALKALDQGVLTVVLEDKEAGDRVGASEALLHGPPGSRWYDKHQLVAFKDSKMGLNLEHSMSDGMNWTRFCHEVMSDVQGVSSGVAPLPALPSVDAPLAPPAKLSFQVSEEVAGMIAAAEKNYAALAGSLDHAVLDLPYGKETFKSWKVSPDAAMQVAYMAAFYKVHGAMPPVYESCTTRRFFVGRTETIRSCTPEAAALAKAVAAGEAGAHLLAKLRQAGETHVATSRDAVVALGSDRHLLGLKYIADRDMDASAPDYPAMFKNPALAASKNWLISSSNATATPFIDQFGFGPTAADGYGLGYLIEKDTVKVAITSFKGSGSKGSNTFKAALEEVLNLFKAEAAKEAK